MDMTLSGNIATLPSPGRRSGASRSFATRRHHARSRIAGSRDDPTSPPKGDRGAERRSNLSGNSAPIRIEDRTPICERPRFLARRAHQIHVSLFSERCAEFRVTPLRYSLLSPLRDLGGEADKATLANAVALDRTTTTGALKRLAARRLVSRSTSPTDRRAQVCRSTANGEALHVAMEAAAREAHARTIETLSPAEREHLVRLMRRIIAGHDDRRGDAGYG